MAWLWGGQRTREFLAAMPGAEVTFIERCSGHDGTCAVKAGTHEAAMKIASDRRSAPA